MAKYRFGPDLLGGHGAFTTDADPYWTVTDASVSIASGVCSFSVAGIQAVYHDTICTQGKTYEVMFTLTRTSGAFQPVIGGTTGGSYTQTGTYSVKIVCGATAGRVRLQSAAAAVFTLDNVIVREVFNTKSTSINLGISGKSSL